MVKIRTTMKYLITLSLLWVMQGKAQHKTIEWSQVTKTPEGKFFDSMVISSNEDTTIYYTGLSRGGQQIVYFTPPPPPIEPRSGRTFTDWAVLCILFYLAATKLYKFLYT